MSWRVFATDASEPDFERLDEGDRAALAEELFGWVESGPPRLNPRAVGGAEVFEDRLPSGFVVA